MGTTQTPATEAEIAMVVEAMRRGSSAAYRVTGSGQIGVHGDGAVLIECTTGDAPMLDSTLIMGHPKPAPTEAGEPR